MRDDIPENTAGIITFEIPVLVDPQGKVNAAFWGKPPLEDTAGEGPTEIESHTDVGILYDSWSDKPNMPIALVKAEVSIDLDEVFKGRYVESESIEVEDIDVPEDE